MCDDGSRDRLRTAETHLKDAEEQLKKKSRTLGSLMTQVRTKR